MGAGPDRPNERTAEPDLVRPKYPTSKVVVFVWLIGVVVIGAVTLQIPKPEALADPDPSHQQGGWTAKPGSWLSGASNSSPISADGLPEGLVGEQRFLLAFAREVPDEQTLLAHREGLEPGVPAVVVVNGPVDGVTPPDGVTLVSDSDGRIAEGLGMRRPVDGGYPIGIAIISSAGLAEYATLDPGWTTNTFECNLVLTDVA